MQVAKATHADITAAFSVNNILEMLQSNSIPEEWLDDGSFDDDWFDKWSDVQCGFALRKLLKIADVGALFRVAMGMSVLTDPVNKIIDPNLDVLDYHPDIKSAANRIAYLETGHRRYEALRRLNPRQFADLYAKNLETGVAFDELVDGLVRGDQS